MMGWINLQISDYDHGRLKLYAQLRKMKLSDLIKQTLSFGLSFMDLQESTDINLSECLADLTAMLVERKRRKEALNHATDLE